MVAVRRGAGRHKTTEEERVPGIDRYWIRAFLGIALVLLVVALAEVYLWAARDAAQGRQGLASDASNLARNAATDLARIRGLLDGLRRDPSIQAAFASGRPAELKSMEVGLKARVPDALAIHLFTPEQTESAPLFNRPQSDSVEGLPFMSYAGLDLARLAAQEQGVTQIEVHKVGQPQMYLALAAPVQDGQGGRILGVIHVAWPMELLPRIDGVEGELGTLRYRQVVGHEGPVLGKGTAPPETEPDLVEPIAGTRLQVAAWMDRKGFFAPRLLGQVGAAYSLVLCLIGVILWLSHRALREDLMQDNAGFALLVDDILHHRPVRKLKSRIAESQGPHQEVAAQLRSLQSGRPIRWGDDAAAEGDVAREGEVPDDRPLTEESSDGEDSDLSDAFDIYRAPVAATPGDGTPGAAQAARDEARAPAMGSGSSMVGDSPGLSPPASIFRAYDIRGLVDRELTGDTVRAIGQALGSAALERGDRTLMIGRDCRASSLGFAAALADGVRSAGPDVVDLGVVPTPLVYFATCHPDLHAGAIVTGSHNPPEYNGIKPVIGGESMDADAIQALRLRIERGDLARGEGAYRQGDVVGLYRDYVLQDLALGRSLKLVVDCGNATASVIAPALYRALGCEVIELNCDLDAGMGSQAPDPSIPEQLRELGDLVLAQGADLGLAFDGDGDRLGVVDSQGRFIAADRVLMLLAADVLTRHPGTDVVFDVKCSRHLGEEILRAGGRPVMWRSGHTPLKAKLRECGGLIGGELSGHIIFKERWFGFDDAIYAGARLLEVLSQDPRPTQEVFAGLPVGLATPELALPLPEGEPQLVMAAILQFAGRLEGVDVILIDGLRAEFDRGWGLVRASNTQPKLTFRFEGDDAQSLAKIQALFRRLMAKAAPHLDLPF